MWGKGLKGRREFLKVEYVAGRRSKDPETRCLQKVYTQTILRDAKIPAVITQAMRDQLKSLVP